MYRSFFFRRHRRSIDDVGRRLTHALHAIVFMEAPLVSFRTKERRRRRRSVWKKGMGQFEMCLQYTTKKNTASFVVVFFNFSVNPKRVRRK